MKCIKMTSLEHIKKKLIDHIWLSENDELLLSMARMMGYSSIKEVHEFSDIQKEILQMSEKDIEAGKIISERELEERWGV